ncbi:restriction system protein [Arthrobacter sp. 49Tsu3.1M3]|uniref:restriction endonuclease n=1 Tax=Arthrobacter sp. 49Tsu3.1M3 TaxID=1279029 RepID=UPI0009A83BB4|nr:restriction endonuclease [Arthrobacter sp. 49Tsu3.1M3]SKB88477.1 restriction system protein [Arthrobacter sp. 49Tsu3.1M3]
MTLPQWHGFVDPVLRIMSDGEIRRNAEIRNAVAERTHLSEEDMGEIMSSGEARWANRINWAVFDSMKAGLLVREARGQYKISGEGLRRASNGSPITYQTLTEYESYRQYQAKSSAPKTVSAAALQTIRPELTAGADSDPSEALEQSASQLNQVVIDEIYRNLMELSPDAFERLIPFVVKALGYGTDREDNLKPTQRSGDKGIDGIVWQDALGFDRVYLQAKRYSEGNNVGAPEVQAFSGALGQFRATKGIFITTSTFTTGARAVARDTAHYTLILIDGQRLASLMFEYGVGVQVDRTVVVKKLDQDFFDSF